MSLLTNQLLIIHSGLKPKSGLITFCPSAKADGN